LTLHNDIREIVIDYYLEKNFPKCELISGALEKRMQEVGQRSGMQLDPNSSESIGVYVPTPQIMNDGIWDAQIEAATAGIEKIGFLADWLGNNRQAWQQWLQPVA
jgi:hypothetical protein